MTEPGDSKCEITRKCREHREETQGDSEIARQTVEEASKKTVVHATFTRHARHKSHIMRGHEIAILLKH